MKELMLTVACFLIVGLGYTQKSDTLRTSSSDKSSTISILCAAQEEVIKELLSKLYVSEGKIDVVKEYQIRMNVRIAECIKADIINIGLKAQENAENGKFKKIHLRFEKPSDKKFSVPSSAKRKYKKAVHDLKKEFPENRKTKTLNEELGSKNLGAKSVRTCKVLTKKFKKNVRRLTKGR